MMYVGAILLTLLAALFALSQIVVLVWVLTGHCCGHPWLGADWDNCLPVQDTAWYAKYFVSGKCDPVTWKRH